MPNSCVHPAAARHQPHSLRLRAVVDETHDAKSLWFELPPELQAIFSHKPGQFLTLRLPIAGRRVLRCYSLSSVAQMDAGLQLTVKRVNKGLGSNWLCDHAKPGDRIEVFAPAGLFTPASLHADFLLLAGGSGITPVFSILRSALQTGSGHITLFYANRDERSVIFREALQNLAAAHPTRLQVIHWLDTVQGVPSVPQLMELARPSRHAQAFICGPGPFMDAAVHALQALGMPGAKIHVEHFFSLPDDDQPSQPDLGEPAIDLEIKLDAQVHRIRCGRNETLLAAALRAGLPVPHSCQAGLCAACMCQVLDGEVLLRDNQVLSQQELNRGWTLSCQALPRSTSVSIQYPE